MQNSKTIQSEIGGYVSTLIREHFGKGPTSVFVIVKPPFVVVHVRGVGMTEAMGTEVVTHGVETLTEAGLFGGGVDDPIDGASGEIEDLV